MKPTVQVITSASRQAYDFRRSATLLYTSTSGIAYLIADLWCGGNDEGECYRSHICKLDDEDHKKIIYRTQFKSGKSFILDSVEFGDLMETMAVTWVRYNHRNPTHRRIWTKSQEIFCTV
jgi:hypothetical protein